MLKIKNYIVAAVGDWNREIFLVRSKGLAGNWSFADTPKALNNLLSSGLKPDFIFFIHWRWIVSESMTDEYECVCFHMTDLPFGRGGSPLQNLIVRGHRNTVLTALKMDSGIDSGPVYIKAPLSLKGAARDIYRRAAELSWDMVREIMTGQLRPAPQVGTVTEFRRRVAAESEIPVSLEVDKMYDYIRMLDADGYPKAFIDVGINRLFFDNAKLEDGILTARVKIRERDPRS